MVGYEMQYLFSTFFVLLLVSFSRAQTEVDGCLLDDLNNAEISALIARDPNIFSGEGDIPVINVMERFNNCMAVGRLRGRFRSITETVIFTGRPAAPTTNQTVQIDFICGQGAGGLLVWQINSQDGFDFITDVQMRQDLTSGRFLTECAACRSTGLDSNDDETLHCDRCDSECLTEEQRLCYGSTSETCCNVYINDVCMNNCPTNFEATLNSSFECVCALMCLNDGTPLSDCSRCNCTEGFTGDLCDTTNPCEPNPCENNGTCINGTFPDFKCDCLPNFTGERCENCNLANCRTCSLTEPGVCLECFNGFLLQEGQCLVNCSICDQREDQCQRNTCRYFCLLNSWSTEANACDLQVSMFTEPSSTLEKPEILRRINAAASTAEGAWTTQASQIDNLLSSVQPPNREGISLAQWVAASKVWIRNLIQWLEYVIAELDATFPSFDLEPLIDQLDDAPQTTYDTISAIWTEILSQFTNRISLQRCT